MTSHFHNVSSNSPLIPNYSPTSPSLSKYRPSVPISIYRQLANELQTTKARLDFLEGENQRLVQQNHQLRQEIDKLLNTAQHLQQVIDSFDPVETSTSVASLPKRTVTAKQVPPPPKKPEILAVEFPENLVAEVEETQSRLSSEQQITAQLSGWLLVVAVVFVVLTAFGSGFLLMRPLLNNSNNR